MKIRNVFSYLESVLVSLTTYGRVIHFPSVKEQHKLQNVTVDDACCAEGTRVISGARKIDYPSDSRTLDSTLGRRHRARRARTKQDALFLLRL